MLQLYHHASHSLQLLQPFRNSGATPHRFCNYSALFATFQIKNTRPAISTWSNKYLFLLIYSWLNNRIVVSGPTFPSCFFTFFPTNEFFETLTVYRKSLNTGTACSFITQQATFIPGSSISRSVFPVFMTESTRITFFVSGLTNCSCLGSYV